MIGDLPDINVWIALSSTAHRHHEAAKRYWTTEALSSVVFTRVTMLGFLRIVTNPKIADHLTNEAAWAQYRSLLDTEGVSMLRDPPEADRVFNDLTGDDTLSHRLWTDTWLASVAIAGRLRLVTFDTDFERFDTLDHLILDDDH